MPNLIQVARNFIWGCTKKIIQGAGIKGSNFKGCRELGSPPQGAFVNFNVIQKRETIWLPSVLQHSWHTSITTMFISSVIPIPIQVQNCDLGLFNGINIIAPYMDCVTHKSISPSLSYPFWLCVLFIYHMKSGFIIVLHVTRF